MTNNQPARPLHLRIAVCRAFRLLLVLSLASSASAAAQPPPSEERVLAALFDFVDVDASGRRFSKRDIEELLIDNDDSLREFMWQTSRQRIRLNVDVLDWITINKRTTDYPLVAGIIYAVTSDAISELSYFADLGSYDKVVLFIHPLAYGNPGCVAYQPRWWTTPNGVFRLGAAVLSGYDMDCVWNGRIAHEYGHTYGFMHSFGVNGGFLVGTDRSRCEPEVLLPPSFIDPTYRQSVYPNGCFDAYIFSNSDWDMLGGDSDELYRMHFPVHFQAVWQAQAGWLRENQVIAAEESGIYEITTLERLDSRPKAIRLLIDHDHQDEPVYYWLQTREFSPWTDKVATDGANFSPCQVDVRLQSTTVYASNAGLTEGCGYRPERRYPSTYFFSMHDTRPELETESIIRRESPLHDPYRGILMEMLGCTVDLDERSAEVEIGIRRTDLKVVPSVVSYFHRNRQSSTVDLSNEGLAPVNVGAVSILGRHASAFAVDGDGCGNRELGAGESCTVTVTYVAEQREAGPGASHAVLMFENDDEIAPSVSVALLGRRIGLR